MKVTFSKLVDWIENRLPAAEAAQVEATVAQDANAQETVAWLRRFNSASQSVQIGRPSQAVRDTLRARFDQYAAQQPSFFERLIATLTFDSHAQLATAGIRSAATEGQQQQLIYTTDSAEIALNIVQSPAKEFAVFGQLFPFTDIPLDDFSVQLVQADSEVQITDTNELGEFELDPLPAGSYELVVSGDLFELVAPVQLTSA